jgi:hypothetical protein
MTGQPSNFVAIGGNNVLAGSNHALNEKTRLLAKKLDLSTLDLVCTSLLDGNEAIQQLAKGDDFTNVQMTPEKYMKTTCDKIINTGYIVNRSILPADETNFSIAFGISIYDDVLPQFERLLRAVYRPHHFYCIHVDGKSKNDTFTAVRKIASCFDNILVPNERGKHSIFHICNVTWKL